MRCKHQAHLYNAVLQDILFWCHLVSMFLMEGRFSALAPSELPTFVGGRLRPED